MKERKLRRARVTVLGHVQGVGFRAFVARRAREFEAMEGWAENQQDGSVIVELQASAGVVAGFLAELRQGPAGSPRRRAARR